MSANECYVCKNPVPEFPEVQSIGTLYNYIIQFENDITHSLQDSISEEDAILSARVQLARAAGLCLDHILKVKKVEKFIGKILG